MFNFASRTAQLNRIITFDLLGIPQDYLFRRAAWGPGGGGEDARARLHPTAGPQQALPLLQ